MSKQSRKFQVPDALANVYDFANSIDLRHFTQHGVQHEQSDDLASPAALGNWLAARGLLRPGAKLTPAMLQRALELRTALRAFLAADAEGRRNKDVLGALNSAAARFPLLAEVVAGRGSRLRPAGKDALAGLGVVVAELHDAAVAGSLDRLKTCAAEECRRVFFDRSKPALRRWCLATLCGNRMKTRAYRERRQAAG
jgi:predicted RNA-binding Zn ribbon-like protein